MIQRLHGVKDHLVVQSSAIKWMRMAYQGGVRGVFRTHIEQGFQPAGGAIEEEGADRTMLCTHFNQTE